MDPQPRLDLEVRLRVEGASALRVAALRRREQCEPRKTRTTYARLDDATGTPVQYLHCTYATLRTHHEDA